MIYRLAKGYEKIDRLMETVEYIDDCHSISIRDAYEGSYSFGTDHAKVYGAIGRYCIDEDIPCPDIILNQDIDYYRLYKSWYDIDEPKLKHICGIATKDRLLLGKMYLSSEEIVPMLKNILQKHKMEGFIPSFDMRNIYDEVCYLSEVLNIPCPVIVSEDYGIRIARNNINYIIVSKALTEKEWQLSTLSHEMRHAWQRINASEKMRRPEEAPNAQESFLMDADSWAELDANAFELIYMRDRHNIEDYINDVRFREDEIKRKALFQRVKEIEECEGLIIKPLSSY